MNSQPRPSGMSTATSSPDKITQRLREALANLDDGFFPASLFHDPNIFDLELKRIFARTWTYIGHESEIPTPGDYVLRYIGRDPFIFARDEHEQLHVFWNSCRHRGTFVCRAERGNTSHFRCPYHGWTYRNTGALSGVPQRHTAYKGLDVEAHGLLEAPRVESYAGLVFANLDPNAESLEARLGPFRWYLDIHFRLARDGMEVIGPPHRWRVGTDWKVGSDNFSGDSYHTQSTHQSLLEVGLVRKEAAGAAGGKNDIHVTECNGCSTSIRRLDPEHDAFWGYPPEVRELFTQDHLTPEQFDLARRSVVHTGNIFPNLSLIHIGASDAPERNPAGYLSLRQWQPIGPGKMEAWSWVFVPRGSPDWYKQRAYRVAMSTFSPSGNFEQDDVAVWEGISAAASSVFAANVEAKFNYQMGLPSVSQAQVLNTWPGPGIAYDTNLEEGVQRTFLRAWLRAMLDGHDAEQEPNGRQVDD